MNLVLEVIVSTPQIFLLVSLIFAAEMVDAAVSDGRHLQIPNRIPIIIITSFILMAFMTGMSWDQLLSHLSAGFIMLLVGLVLFAKGIWGGGDAKLLPAVALWVGLSGQPHFWIIMSLVGGLLSVGILIAPYLPFKPVLSSGQVPYGIAIAAAGLNWWAISIIPQLAGKS